MPASQMTRPNGIANVWTYEPHRDLITQVQNGTASTYGYVNDAIGRRTSMSRSGSAYPTSDVISYAYNDRSELTGAASNVDAAYSYSYAYDPIGNRTAASEAGVPWTYTTNNLNQYTSASENNSNLAFSYDLDGSMSYRPVDATGGWTQVWNCENRMAETYRGADRLTFRYDYMGRRVEKCVYNGETLASRTLFVYDGFKCVQELDGMDGNAVLRTHFWQPPECGLDVILATSDASGTAFFLHDANKNVMQYLTIISGNLFMMEYNPWGKNTGSNCLRIGFSSEYYDDETTLVSYVYRDYDPKWGIFTSRDFLEKLLHDFLIDLQGNQYFYLQNECVNGFDVNGLASSEEELIIDIIKRVNPISRSENREYCGMICQNCKTKDLSYTLTKGTIESCTPESAPCAAGTKAVSAWHTHANSDEDYASEEFSAEDEDWLKVPFRPDHFYLITPSDRVLIGRRYIEPVQNGNKRIIEPFVLIDQYGWENWNKKHPRKKGRKFLPIKKRSRPKINN